MGVDDGGRYELVACSPPSSTRPAAGAEGAAGGQSASGTFTIDRPGTYTFICSQPGHEAGGMKGTITAQ